jgi:hypothetical protein
MDAARKRLWWRAAGVALLVLVSAAVFSAYLSPTMLGAFADAWAFCASLIR